MRTPLMRKPINGERPQDERVSEFAVEITECLCLKSGFAIFTPLKKGFNGSSI